MITDDTVREWLEAEAKLLGIGLDQHIQRILTEYANTQRMQASNVRPFKSKSETHYSVQQG